MLDAVLARFGLQDSAPDVRTALMVLRAGEVPTPRQLATAVVSAVLLKSGVPNDAAIRAVLALDRLTDTEFADLKGSAVLVLDGTYIRLPEPASQGRHYRMATMEAVNLSESYIPLVGFIVNPSRILASLP